MLAWARRTQDPADAARFRSPAGLVYPAADVLEVRPQGRRSARGHRGNDGPHRPSGVLPRYYSEVVTQTLRARSAALRDFLDMLAHRFVAFFARAGVKYRPARTAETASLRGADAPDTGRPGPARADRLWHAASDRHGSPPGCEPLLHYAGLFALRPRSADRLGAMLSDWLGMHVEVVEFAGAWLPLPPDQRTRLSVERRLVPAGRRCRGRRAGLGPSGAHHPAVGPLDLQGFQRLLPDRVALHRLVSLVRAYVGFELGFADQSGAGRAPGAPAAAERRRPIRRRCSAGTPGCPGPASGFTARGGCGGRGVRGRGDRGAAGATGRQGETAA